MEHKKYRLITAANTLDILKKGVDVYRERYSDLSENEKWELNGVLHSFAAFMEELKVSIIECWALMLLFNQLPSEDELKRLSLDLSDLILAIRDDGMVECDSCGYYTYVKAEKDNLDTCGYCGKHLKVERKGR